MGAIRDVLSLADCRRIEIGWFSSLAGELAGTIAMLVYAHGEGGASLVAVYGVARTVPTILVTPLVVNLTDRISPDQVLRATLILRTTLFAAAGLGAAAGASPAVVITTAAASSWLAGAYRPIQASVLPWLARTPGELTAANVVAALMENAGALIGPVLAGLALVTLGVPAAIGLAAVALAIGVMTVWRLEVPRPRGEVRGPTARAALAGVASGSVDLARLAPPSGVTILVFAQTFARGALTVLTVILALETLVMGEPAVGWLSAATGVGGLIGGSIAAATISVSRLGRSFVAGLLLWGLPLVLLAAVPSPVMAYAALLIVGIGNAIEDVALFTLLPRAFRPWVVGRVLGALELTVFAGIGAGTIAAPLLAGQFGVFGSLGLIGGGLTGLAVAYAIPFIRLDAGIMGPGPDADLLRRNPIFAPLPLATVELLATELTSHTFAAGEVVIAEGDVGDRFHLIAEGTAAVSIAGEPRSALGPGDGFGEIALLRNVPRTATVVAATHMRTRSLARDVFLVALSSNHHSAASAERVASERLADG